MLVIRLMDTPLPTDIVVDVGLCRVNTRNVRKQMQYISNFNISFLFMSSFFLQTVYAPPQKKTES